MGLRGTTRPGEDETRSSLAESHTCYFQKIIIVKDNIVAHHNEPGIMYMSLFDFMLKQDSI